MLSPISVILFVISMWRITLPRFVSVSSKLKIFLKNTVWNAYIIQCTIYVLYNNEAHVLIWISSSISLSPCVYCILTKKIESWKQSRIGYFCFGLSTIPSTFGLNSETSLVVYITLQMLYKEWNWKVERGFQGAVSLKIAWLFNAHSMPILNK